MFWPASLRHGFGPSFADPTKNTRNKERIKKWNVKARTNKWIIRRTFIAVTLAIVFGFLFFFRWRDLQRVWPPNDWIQPNEWDVFVHIYTWIYVIYKDGCIVTNNTKISHRTLPCGKSNDPNRKTKIININTKCNYCINLDSSFW